MKESKLQADIIDWLKSNGVYVIKTRVLPGVPAGCPDIIGLYKDRWVALEVKKAPNAPYRPGQQATLQRLKFGNEFVYRVDPITWPTVKMELSKNFL